MFNRLNPFRNKAALTHLSFTALQDCINVVVCDLALLGGEHVRGAVADNRQHLVLTQLVCTRIHQPSCKTWTAVLRAFPR